MIFKNILNKIIDIIYSSTVIYLIFLQTLLLSHVFSNKIIYIVYKYFLIYQVGNIPNSIEIYFVIISKIFEKNIVLSI